ncbi:MAG: glycosyl transferase family 2 [Prevotella sp.]|nr:glycosyl transferase family 2 [Prevotella sp.]
MNFLTFDNFTIISSLVLLFLSIVTPMLNPFFRFKKKEYSPEAPSDTSPTTLPPLSIVLTPFDDIVGLRNNLPHLLQQDYPAGYQVIVVIEQGDHDAEAVIGSIRDATLHHTSPQSVANLYVTYIPKSSRYISRKKLAITLGIKAAQTEWILLTETACRPTSDLWLSSMARHCSEDHHLIIGYGKFNDETSSYRRFERLQTSYYLMREASRGTVYRDNSFNVMFRKSDFMAGDGYLGNLNLMRGEYDFLVNKHALQGATSLETAEEAWLTEDEPTDKSWLNRHIYYLESRKSLDRGLAHRILFNLDQTALHLNLLLQLGFIASAAILQNWTLLSAAALSLIITFTFRTLLCGRALRSFDEDISPIGAVFYEISIVWHQLWYMIRYRLADKRDFTTHKL